VYTKSTALLTKVSHAYEIFSNRTSTFRHDTSFAAPDSLWRNVKPSKGDDVFDLGANIGAAALGLSEPVAIVGE
jgi:hypothetical protein